MQDVKIQCQVDEVRFWWWLHNSVNVLKSTDLYTSCEWFVCMGLICQCSYLKTIPGVWWDVERRALGVRSVHSCGARILLVPCDGVLHRRGFMFTLCGSVPSTFHGHFAPYRFQWFWSQSPPKPSRHEMCHHCPRPAKSRFTCSRLFFWAVSHLNTDIMSVDQLALCPFMYKFHESKTLPVQREACLIECHAWGSSGDCLCGFIIVLLVNRFERQLCPQQAAADTVLHIGQEQCSTLLCSS